MNRLEQQIAFIVEIDKLKAIYRQSYITGGARNETDAEHSWHMAVMAILLAEHVGGHDVDVLKVIKMLLIHDIVEIDAGDTYCYDALARQSQAQREQAAADRLFGILPEDQMLEFRALWEEFELMTTPEARFAAALDRLQPLLLQYHTSGKSWQEHDIVSAKVKERNQHIKHISQTLAELVEEIIEDSVQKGYLLK
ncbi:HD domain-containing protein [bacterium BFN5]|nr:HD domain-containing protein [bacterium BFN5]QJW46888.1 HD domain-containing protein [bacterium BFN5]